ncbi:sigma-54-dependent transcriptional regulator [Denitratisoma oestradiolicum]|uniref:Type 4 fimbriae expression regulatory protein PilR n=1 Tax=Denitratisoma oestradiolicum TaxID=311182 RepID=A0A6S6XWL4_9PROT|nr:sigma-54 dependent transcriptional regulator [Denitratisoma oestradiolicum]TWO79606.1 sigma-54-dependent Fis family transcriptional regulator [Denitratisoma oestradiolicum]CAB1370404.1 Type 4 fimbriae expression regulatory protein PilR [Denitratisoma oestradiolicum]
MATNLERASKARLRVLVVDDEADIRELLDLTLARMGLGCDCVGTLAEARRLLAQGSHHLCLTDMRLPDGDGLELVRHIGEHVPDMPVAVITAHGSAENAVSALKAGAFDYLTKPVSLDQLRALVKSAMELPVAVEQREQIAAPSLLGQSPAMTEARDLIERMARSQAPVHITGESGSGKELAARLIHRMGARQQGPFVPVNCGAIPENLMESEFFGYRKGAFTGADADRDGFFQVAQGGTLFLDEVADLPLSMQVKLLRAIQEKKVRRVGSPGEESVDVRLISATHQNLRRQVEQGRFRQDLQFRLNVLELRMPALRECREDIPLLATRVLERLAAQAASDPAPSLTAAALRALSDYPFPGNVRELENILERALALRTTDCIDSGDLNLIPPAENQEVPPLGQLSLQDHLDRVERQAILEALQKTRFNRTAAARLLGVTFRSLRYRMERLGLND